MACCFPTVSFCMSAPGKQVPESSPFSGVWGFKLCLPRVVLRTFASPHFSQEAGPPALASSSLWENKGVMKVPSEAVPEGRPVPKPGENVALIAVTYVIFMWLKQQVGLWCFLKMRKGLIQSLHSLLPDGLGGQRLLSSARPCPSRALLFRRGGCWRLQE